MTDGRRRRLLRSALAATALALLVLVARVRYTDSDPRANLLTAQALLETGSVRLDRYLAVPGSPGAVRRDLVAGDWTIWRHGGHLYNIYPPGTPLLALPAVAVALAAGFDCAQPADDRRLQVLLSALVVAASFLLFEALARLHLPDGAAFVAALVLVLGTSVSSTLGTALWSHGPSMLLAGLALLHLLGRWKRGEPPSGAALGVLLFGAWISRPTAVIPAALVAAALFLRARRQLLPFVLVAGSGVALFAAACWAETGLLLPAYYRVGNWPAGAFPVTAFAGVLASPGRGLFAFSPVLLLGLLPLASRRWRREDSIRLSAAWSLGLALVVARQGDWWGGWSYGPRLLVDSLPAWVVLVTAGGALLRERFPGGARRAAAGTMLLALALASVGIHSVQGLFNRATISWNDGPNVYEAPREKLFDWTNPQFAATWERNRAARERWEARRPTPAGGR